MNICSYCGRENEDRALLCVECGTPLEASETEEQKTVQPPPLPSTKPVLDAWRATLILLVYLGAQGFGIMLVIAIGAFISAASQGKDVQDEKLFAELKTTLVAPAALIGQTIGAVLLLITSRFQIPEHIRNCSSSGAAWVMGSWKEIAQGFSLGLLTASSYLAVEAAFFPPKAQVTYSPFTQLAVTPGFSQFTWLVVALLLAPPFEELLFRGVVYGGYRRSFGPAWAGVLTTFIFVILHIGETIHFLPSMIGLTGLAMVTLWLRLHFGAIGPAVAAHFGYNAVCTLGLVYYHL